MTTGIRQASIPRPFAAGRRGVTAVLLAVGSVTLAGCASMGSATPEQRVQARAEAFWNARVKAEPTAAYALMTPAYRALRDQQAFLKQFGAGSGAESSQIAKVTCEPEKCTVRVGLTGKPIVPGLNLPTVTTYMDETWLLVDGQWWRHEAP